MKSMHFAILPFALALPVVSSAQSYVDCTGRDLQSGSAGEYNFLIDDDDLKIYDSDDNSYTSFSLPCRMEIKALLVKCNKSVDKDNGVVARTVVVNFSIDRSTGNFVMQLYSDQTYSALGSPPGRYYDVDFHGRCETGRSKVGEVHRKF